MMQYSFSKLKAIWILAPKISIILCRYNFDDFVGGKIRIFKRKAMQIGEVLFLVRNFIWDILAIFKHCVLLKQPFQPFSTLQQ